VFIDPYFVLLGENAAEK